MELKEEGRRERWKCKIVTGQALFMNPLVYIID
jgi:hypothetical protein